LISIGGRGGASLFASSFRKRRLARKSPAFEIIGGIPIGGISLDDVSSNRVSSDGRDSVGEAAPGVEVVAHLEEHSVEAGTGAEVAPKVEVTSFGKNSDAKAICSEAAAGEEVGSDVGIAPDRAAL